MLTRRLFLHGSAIAMAGVGSAPRWLARAASTGEGKRKILVAIFQRGACDGLNVVVPFAEKRYSESRPTIGIRAPAGGGASSMTDARIATGRVGAAEADPNIVLGPNEQNTND